MYDAIASNKRRSVLLIFVFVLMIAGIGYVFGMYSKIGEYAVIPAVAIALALSWASYYYSDKLVLSMSGARPVTHDQEPQLANAVEGLRLAVGIPMPALYVIEDGAPNAFATGRDPQHAALAVTRGLLQKMNRVQLEGVVAHEMSHIRNYDIRFMTLVSVLVGTVVMLSDWMTRSLWYGGGRQSRSSDDCGGGGSPLLMLIGLIFVVLSPIIAQPDAARPLSPPRIPGRRLRGGTDPLSGRAGERAGGNRSRPGAAGDGEQGHRAPLHHEPAARPRRLAERPLRHPPADRGTGDAAEGDVRNRRGEE